MAIVFVSPKERQKIFVLIIVIFFVLLVVTIGLLIYFAQPKMPENPELVFVAPKIKINFDVLKSEQVKNLTVLPGVDKQFDYQAKDTKGAIKTGRIVATSAEEATNQLVSLGFNVEKLTELTGGRTNPFDPYYKIEVPIKKK